MEKEKEAETKKEKEYVLVQVPTEHQIMIQTPDGEVLPQPQALVEVLNKLDKILKQIL